MSKLYDYSDLTKMETQVGMQALPRQQFVTPLPGVGEEPTEEYEGDKIVPPSPAYMSKLTGIIMILLTLGLVISIVIIGLTIIK